MGVSQEVFRNNQPPQCEDKHLNAYTQEINNAISSQGLPITDDNWQQLADSIIRAAMSGSYFDYSYSGTPNTIILTKPAGRKAPTNYFNGMRVLFYAQETNTGAVTVNVSGLGGRPVTQPGGDDIKSGSISGFTEIIFNESANRFEYLSTQKNSLLTAKDFKKSSTWESAFTVAGGVVRTTCDITVIVGDRVVTASSNETIDTPTLVIGADYAIYATFDGLLASSNFTVPDGYTESNSRRIGGFHYGDNEFKTHSFYDLHFRPRARDPRGMVLDMGERFWADIYLTNTTPDLLGTSAYDTQIADNNSAPKIPSLIGGDGAQQYSNFTQFTANELLGCFGKRLPNYQEFQMLARGSVSGYARGSDPVKTLFDSSARSTIGCEQVSGHMWQWGSDVWDRGNGTSGYEWYDITGGYGQMYASNSQAVGASRFGGAFDISNNAGSRASHWETEPSQSDGTIASRGLCDHLLIV